MKKKLMNENGKKTIPKKHTTFNWFEMGYSLPKIMELKKKKKKKKKKKNNKEDLTKI